MRVAAGCLLAGAAILGAAHIALLPPWEGFDEEAHYSSVQQIAHRREVPERTTARISQVVVDYAGSAPMRYPVERRVIWPFTYRSFFEATDDVVARGRLAAHAAPPEARGYVPSARWNWESQHPPLYYAALVPAYLLTSRKPLGTQLFVLRSVSYLFAWLALLIGIGACAGTFPPRNGDTTDRNWSILGIAAWPVLFPGWFPEMARLGNDSLCALVAAAVWWMTRRTLREGPTLRRTAALGVVLALGWLSKALFVPITAGLLAFWLARAWRHGGLRAVLALAPHVGVAGAVIAVIAGWWYVDRWHRYGATFGLNELVALQERGGLVAGLHQHFTIGALGRFLASFVSRFAWPGTWSLARPEYVSLVPLVLLVVVAAAAYLWVVRRSRVTEPEWLPVWLVAPLVLGFGQHMLVRIALTGEGSGFGGYYLHLLVAPLGAALGFAISFCWRRKATRALWIALSLYSVVFAIAMSWAQVLLFAGILSRSDARFYAGPERWPALFGVPEALGRLAVIAFPAIGAVAWLVGGALALAGLLGAYRTAAALPLDDARTAEN